MTDLSVQTVETTLSVAGSAPTLLIADLDTPLVLEVAGSEATLSVTVAQAGVLVAPAEQGPMGPQGHQGEPGTPGAAASVSFYPINNVASFTAPHGLSFSPRTWIVDVSGEVLDTDTFHAPGQVTVIFASPFTGTLYLG